MDRIQRIALAIALAGAALFLGAELAMRLAPGHASTGLPPGAETDGRDVLDAAQLAPGLQSSAKIPAVLPEFKLRNLQGTVVSIERWQGQSLMINFWATWCAPCRREIPLLQSIHEQSAGQSTEVIGIAVDHPEQVSQFSREFGISYPLLVGEQDALDVAARLGVANPAFPFTVFTARKGQIVALYLGELKRDDVRQILQIIDRLNQNQLNLADAQRQIAAELARKSP